ncbi:hypothetical protein [Ruegeria sp. Alg231-54]|uniref:hypothetical protein n=1 Tax=Ruegeria sp. Alg231-54 TaxID=1922221 RepID=UPI000D5556CF|nr:hypothetical protein [Ruegeria sp. Alg231-54]
MNGFGAKKLELPSIKKLTHDPDRWEISIFCNDCADFERCGGIATQLGGHCYMHCCGGKEGCQTVCRNNPEFVAQTREIAGFDLANVPRTKPLKQQSLAGTAPLLAHRKIRRSNVSSEIVAVKLREIVQLKSGQLRYHSYAELAEAMRFYPGTKVIVTGIEQDKWVEPWWSLGREKRRELLRELACLGISLVTPPNFSLFCDQPRPSDFSAMKRIALVQSEFLEAGIPCALHPHIVTATDSERWVEFVSKRPEIQTIAYEFTTGAGRSSVRRRHIDHLISLAKSIDRPLDLVLRGDQKLLPELAAHYRNTVYIDTNAFMKTMHRKFAIRTSNLGLGWKSVKTPDEISIDSLLQHNILEVAARSRILTNSTF